MYKTGGTFITTVLLDLYHRKLSSHEEYAAYRLLRRLVRIRDGRLVLRYPWLIPAVCALTRVMPIEIAQHATRSQLPPGLLSRQILGIVRNPYDYYVSHYEFGSWKYSSPLKQQSKSVYPQFPELSFTEFMDLIHRPQLDYDPESEAYLGVATYHLFQFYSLHPISHVVQKHWIANRQYETDLANVHFLRTHCLNQDLYDFLCRIGYPHERIRHICKQGKILPRQVDARFKRRTEKWEVYYTPELKQFVRQHDDIIFRLFPEFDV
jgi:hypothetical protein